MAYLDLDLTVPMVLLASAIAGVIVVRYAVARGDAQAKDKTRRLLREHGLVRGEDARPTATD